MSLINWIFLILISGRYRLKKILPQKQNLFTVLSVDLSKAAWILARNSNLKLGNTKKALNKQFWKMQMTVLMIQISFANAEMQSAAHIVHKVHREKPESEKKLPKFHLFPAFPRTFSDPLLIKKWTCADFWLEINPTRRLQINSTLESAPSVTEWLQSKREIYF